MILDKSAVAATNVLFQDKSLYRHLVVLCFAFGYASIFLAGCCAWPDSPCLLRFVVSFLLLVWLRHCFLVVVVFVILLSSCFSLTACMHTFANNVFEQNSTQMWNLH